LPTEQKLCLVPLTLVYELTLCCYWLGFCTFDAMSAQVELPAKSGVTLFVACHSRGWNMNDENVSRDAKVPNLTKSNINAIMHIEQDFLQHRSVGDRISDTISALAGSIGFVVV